MARDTSEKLGSPDWILLGTTAALIAVGMMMVLSSTFDLSYHLHGKPTQLFLRHALLVAVGAVAMFLASQMHYKHWMKFSIPLMVLTLGTLVAVAMMGQRRLFGESVSPVELAKLTTVVYVGHWLASKRVEQLRRLPFGLLPFTVIVGLIAGLVIVQPDISEAVVIVLVALTMFFVAGADLLQFAIGILGGGAVFVFVVSRIPYAIERLGPHLAEWRDPLNGGNYQLRQGLIGLGSGGIFGLGPGSGRMKYQWLPTPHTDAIFAVVGEELGLVGCLFLVGLYALLAYRGFRISERVADPFGRFLAIGISSWISLQALINMAVITGTIPYSGLALPFISVGGSSMVFSMLAVGILLSVSRATSIVTVVQKHSRQDRQSKRVAETGEARTWSSQHRSSNLELET